MRVHARLYEKAVLATKLTERFELRGGPACARAPMSIPLNAGSDRDTLLCHLVRTSERQTPLPSRASCFTSLRRITESDRQRRKNLAVKRRLGLDTCFRLRP